MNEQAFEEVVKKNVLTAQEEAILRLAVSMRGLPE
jgi:hypothetical protein